MKCITMAAASLLASAPVMAARPAADPRVVERHYHADTVIDIVADHGYQTTIAFVADEQVENIAIGSSGEWQVTPNRRADRMFIKPTGPAVAPTNMTVITNRRTYLFALRAGRRGTPLFLLRFTYPDDAKNPQPATSRAASARTGSIDPGSTPPGSTPAGSTDLAPLSSQGSHTVNPAKLNFAWATSGSRAILPDRLFDDGKSVFLGWPAGKAMPAILIPGPDGKSEGLVNYTSDGPLIVVEGAPNRLILRSGKTVAVLDRRKPAASPPPPDDAGVTTPALAAPGIERP